MHILSYFFKISCWWCQPPAAPPLQQRRRARPPLRRHAQQPAHVQGCSIAVVNSVGNLGGFIGPYLIGAAHDAVGRGMCRKDGGGCTAQWGLGTLVLGAATLSLTAVLAVAVRRRVERT